MVGIETAALAVVEPKCEIPPFLFLMSNRDSKQGPGPCMVGSLTGAVASQRVTEARDGKLRPVGNRLLSARA